MSEELKADNQILPFDSYPRDVGNTYFMLHQAIALLQTTWVQPPHWQCLPTYEMLEAEEKLLRKGKEAEKEVGRLAGQIYFALTGRLPEFGGCGD